MNDAVDIAVCIATYSRQAGLHRLLESLQCQSAVSGTYGIVVVDNDAAGSAKPVVEPFLNSPVPLRYVVEPEPGIPAARNRSIAEAREMGAEFVAFIDDDEYASNRWLAALMARQRSSHADAVSGPVEPLFPDNAPSWASASGVFHRRTFEAGRELDYASTANSLLRLDAIAGQVEPFSRAFQFTGGSDSYLYHSLRACGGRIVWEPGALVYEHVLPKRISLRWVLARSYRQGITLARCDRLIYRNYRKMATRAARGAAQIPLGAIEFLGALVLLRVTWRNALVRIARGVGSIVGLFGVTYQEYERPKPDTDP